MHEDSGFGQTRGDVRLVPHKGDALWNIQGIDLLLQSIPQGSVTNETEVTWITQAFQDSDSTQQPVPTFHW
jgi:hypothetical protein